MATEVAYKKVHENYKRLAAERSPDKAKAFQEVRAMERELNREGKVAESGQIVSEGPTKRSLQEEYVRKFDSKTPVMIQGKQTTLREYHKKRLLG